MLDAKAEKEALATCENEPIRTPDRVQPHGVVLIADLTLGPITHLSANVADLIPGASTAWLGTPLKDHLTDKDAHMLRNTLSLPSIRAQREFMGLFEIQGQPVQAAAIVVNEMVVLELVPAQGTSDVLGFGLDRVRWLLSRQSRDLSLSRALNRMVRDLRNIVGYDRVMAYRFRPDGSGEVLAESRLPSMDSFVGLRFPAQDIPQVARAICLDQPIRIIGDTSQTDVPLLAAPDQTAPVDMTLLELRGTSPVHLQYLNNMGVGASLVLPIITDNTLWGLFSCHHRSARLLSIAESVTFELVGKTLATSIDGILRQELTENVAHSRSMVEGLKRETQAKAGTFYTQQSWRACTDNIMPLFRCDGVLLTVGGTSNETGLCPAADRLAPFADALRDSLVPGVATADGLLRDGISQGAIAGALRIELSAKDNTQLWLFRREENEAVQWAGSPQKEIERSTEGTRLHPRSSFKIYEEQTAGCSRAWEPEDIQMAAALKTALQQSVDQELERDANETRLLLMVQELNHRVRNILNMMQSIASLTKSADIDVDEYAESLRRRLLALATAHDLLATANNAGVNLRSAIDLEIDPFRSHVIQFEGPDLRLQPNASTLLVLVLHEIVTNAAKYGGFSTAAGKVSVSWAVEDDHLVLRWRETGVPSMSSEVPSGFGTFLITQGIRHQLAGKAEMVFGDDTTEITLTLPQATVLVADMVVAQTAEAEKEADLEEDDRLGIASVLVLEDNFLIAAQLEETLTDFGIKDVMLSRSNAAAVDLIASTPPDFAILDVNLGNEDSETTARLLEKLNIPFILLTGYSEIYAWLSEFGEDVVVNKPLRPDTMRTAMERRWAAKRGDM